MKKILLTLIAAGTLLFATGCAVKEIEAQEPPLATEIRMGLCQVAEDTGSTFVVFPFEYEGVWHVVFETTHFTGESIEDLLVQLEALLPLECYMVA